MYPQLFDSRGFWYFGDGSVAYTNSTVSHLYQDTGTYEVKLIVYHGMCSDTLTQTVIVSNNVGLHDSSLEGGQRWVSIYPNPNSGTFILENRTGRSLRLEVQDALGKVVLKQEIHSAKENMHLDLENGIYFIRLSNKFGSFTQKLIIKNK